MPKLFIIFILAFLSVACASSSSACDWEIAVVNLSTGEKKIYSPSYEKGVWIATEPKLKCMISQIHSMKEAPVGSTTEYPIQRVGVVCWPSDPQFGFGSHVFSVAGQKATNTFWIVDSKGNDRFRINIECK